MQEEEETTGFGDDLIQSLNETLAHARGEGPATVYAPAAPRDVRKQATRKEPEAVQRASAAEG